LGLASSGIGSVDDDFVATAEETPSWHSCPNRDFAGLCRRLIVLSRN
jgi:hypothetical protein